MSEVRKITHEEFAGSFNIDAGLLPERVKSELDRIDSRFSYAGLQEEEGYILDYLKLLDSPQIVRTTEENYAKWETGWREHIGHILDKGVSMATLKPLYFRPSRFLRYRKKIIAIKNPCLEYDLFTAVRYHLFLKYLFSSENIYELGCGSCQNLFMLSELFPEKEIIGFDWTKATCDIAEIISKKTGRSIKAHRLDLAAPSAGIAIKPGSAIFSIHALEQLGNRHERLLDFIIAAKPGIVLNYEPVMEFYDPENVLDYLALSYSRKRDYLSGYWTALNRLQKEGKIEIISGFRPYVGGVLHESSLIIWRPLV